MLIEMVDSIWRLLTQIYYKNNSSNDNLDDSNKVIDRCTKIGTLKNQGETMPTNDTNLGQICINKRNGLMHQINVTIL